MLIHFHSTNKIFLSIIIIDRDFKRSDSGSDYGEGVSVHPIPDSCACVGEREMSIGARPVPVASDNQETNNIATLTVTYEIDDNNTVTCEIKDKFCVITINSKCKVHCIV